MTRSLDPWQGATDDTTPPPRVRLRIWEKYEGRCALCTRKVGAGHEPVEFDHVVALINGGTNSEDNIVPVCRTCHREKSNEDVAEKATVARKKGKLSAGITRKSRPMPGSKLSGFRKRMDGTVERR